MEERRRRVVVHRSLKPARQHLPLSGPPSPLASPDLRILRAWLDAETAHPGDREAVVAVVETAVRQVMESLSRRLLGRYYYRVPAEVRPLLGQPGQEGLKQLLGHFGRDGVTFIPGLAGLTERESEIYWLSIRGWTRAAIQHHLAPAEHKADRSRWISLKTVSNHQWAAKVKVLQTFRLPAPDYDLDQDES